MNILTFAAAPVLVLNLFAGSAALAQQGAGPDDALEPLVAAGERIYRSNCARCHAQAGTGYVGPPLAGNDRIRDDARVFRQIRRGGDDMPPFGKKLTPEQIVAVGTFIRNSWGNDYGILVEEAAEPQ